ncbi:MAG: hypothetical protein PHG96_03940 [Kiritimatiellae bacterium]|nr:hypothetical protein [Kiritimatiellia bacterium]MDD3544494.1 hypothetical protein [Kiritimatiellia bacterium]
MKTIFAFAVAGCIGMAAAKPLIILNEDCNHFISQYSRSAKGKSGAPMQPADIVGYVDQWLHPAVTHYFVNPNGQAACYDSKVLETCWQTHRKIGCACTSVCVRTRPRRCGSETPGTPRQSGGACPDTSGRGNPLRHGCLRLGARGAG